MAKVIAEAGVKPEIELFDSGDIALMRDLLADGTLQGPVLCSFVMGVRYGFQPSQTWKTENRICSLMAFRKCIVINTSKRIRRAKR